VVKTAHHFFITICVASGSGEMEFKMFQPTPTLNKTETLWDNSIIQDKSLSLFQKVLLNTDGTVTNLLSLYTGEKIKVKKIEQIFTLSNEEQAWLFPPETPILIRKILLSGEIKNYIYADSIYNFELHSRSIQYQLLETNQPIGLLWKEEKLENYREIIDFKMEPAHSLTAYFDITPETPLLSRTYLIYHQKAVLGIITEKFPITYFRGE
jgi:chorismate-pyruvate lyase